MIAAIVSLLLLAAPAAAEVPSSASGGNSPMDLANPRAAVHGYLVAARAARYDEAARFLDLSQIPEHERAERGPILARQMKIVLDQKLWIDLETLSDRPDGNPDDGLSMNRDRVGTIETSRGHFDINVMPTPGPGGHAEWRFTPWTLDRIEVLYAELGYGRMLRWLPDWATRMRFGNIEGWQWIALLLLAVVSGLLSRLLTRAVYWLVRALNRKTDPEFRNRILDSVRLPVRLTAALGFVLVGTLALRLSVPAKRMLGHVTIGLLVVLTALTLMRLADLATSRTLDKLQAQGRRSGVSTLILLRRVAKGVILAVAGLAILQNLGFNVTGLLAGFGIAGAAVALAAQKTIENLFGGLVLTADEPVRIGDFCRFGDKQGTIEDVGLRSTRVRTLDRTIISVPNAELSTVQIENFALRDRIRLQAVLNLRYETSPEQMTAVLERIRALLRDDPRVSPLDMRVRFIAFGPYSLDVEMIAYILTDDVPTFFEIREDLFLKVMKIVTESGTGFAFPSQTLYMARDQGVEAGAPGS